MPKKSLIITFEQKIRWMMILVSGYMCLMSRNLLVPLVFTYDLDLQGHDLCNHILGHIWVTTWQNIAKLPKHMVNWVRPFKQIKNILSSLHARQMPMHYVGNNFAKRHFGS